LVHSSITWFVSKGEGRGAHTDLFAVFVILVLGEARVLDETGELFELFKSLLQSCLSEFTKGKLVLVVSELF